MKEKLKNKKVIGSIIASIVIIALVVFIFMNQSSLKVKSKEVIVEYGNQISLKAVDYLDEDEKTINKTTVSIKEDAAIEEGKNYYPVGEYTLVLACDKESAEVKIIIKDTTAPEFKDFKDTLETVKDVKPEYSKLYVSDDLSETDIICDDQNVKYDAVGEYKATIKAVDSSKNEITKEITVKVTEPTIKLNKESITLFAQETAYIKAEVIGKDSKAEFKSKDQSIATIDSNGKVNAKNKGTTSIVATANGKEAICKVTVKSVSSGSKTSIKKDGDGNTVTVVIPSENGSINSNQSSQQSASLSKEAFNLINQERVSRGLSKLAYASDLESVALARAKSLTKNFSHSGSGSYYSNGVGRTEVITQLNSVNNASRAVSNWMNSSAHKESLLDESNTSLIVASCENCWVAIIMYKG